MIYDMRTYDLNPGALQAYMDAVREVALPLREDYGVKLAGWYYTDIGKLNRVVHIWAYRDYTHFDQARQAVRSDPDGLMTICPASKGWSHASKIKLCSRLISSSPGFRLCRKIRDSVHSRHSESVSG